MKKIGAIIDESIIGMQVLNPITHDIQSDTPVENVLALFEAARCYTRQEAE
jgi:hypothetical protein